MTRKGTKVPRRKPSGPISLRYIHLPIGPLEEVIKPTTCLYNLALRRNMCRWRKAGYLTVDAADKVCVEYLNITPIEVWGKVYEDIVCGSIEDETDPLVDEWEHA